MITQVFWFLILTWETFTEFQSPGFDLAEPQLLQVTEEGTNGWQISVSQPFK